MFDEVQVTLNIVTTENLCPDHVHVEVSVDVHQECIGSLSCSRYHENYLLSLSLKLHFLNLTYIVILDIVELDIVICYWDWLPDFWVNFVVELVHNA